MVRGDVEWMRRHRERIRKRLCEILSATPVRVGVLRAGWRRLEFLVTADRNARTRWMRARIHERSLFFENIFQQSSWTGTYQTWRE